ncbi:MAG: helix-turn-helix domain-containing protein [Armatimonadetes bacterium]|jgi:excisionase family DNA binding protein|nr:helix-turn-helix domain-containing protein [Armatimonadota bacterium]MDI9585409.1 helix-turn-helix domain-containing protein [Acidobacteriota bacterium]
MMEFWGTNKAAQYLNMHPETLRRKAKLNQVPAYRVGGRWKYQKETLDEWMAKGCPQQDGQSPSG